MSLEVIYIDVPQGAQEAAAVTGPGQPFSQAQTVAAGAADIPYATLEPFSWVLDGTRQLMGKDADFWWSLEPSDAEGEFEVPPVLEFSFPEPYTATGLSFSFWPSLGRWCSALTAAWYSGNTLLAEQTVYPDSPRWALQQTVEGFDRIRITLLATNTPYSFAMVQKITLGQTHHFTADALTAVGLLREADPTLCALTVDTMTVQLRTPLQLLPQENQTMELYRDGTLLAVQYISESQRQGQLSYSISCQSAMGLLETQYLGGMYQAVPAEMLLADILEGREFTLHSALAGQTVTGYLPVCTRREALQQVAFALGALVTTQCSRAVELSPLPEAVSGTLASGRVFSGARVESAPRLSRVTLTEHSYVPAGDVETLLDHEELHGEAILLTFDAPHCDYTISGGSITDSGANFVTVTADGAVTLTARPYQHTAIRHTRCYAGATAAQQSNVLTVEDATLVHSGNAQQVLSRLYAAGQLRQRLELDAVIAGHHAGQRVGAVSPWGTQLQGYIAAMDASLTHTGHTASVTILGTEAVPEPVLYYAGELYAQSQTHR